MRLVPYTGIYGTSNTIRPIVFETNRELLLVRNWQLDLRYGYGDGGFGSFRI